MRFEHVQELLPDAVENEHGWYNGIACPSCEKTGKFGFREGENGWARFNCFKECDREAIQAALGKRVGGVFDYENEAGTVIAQRVRFEYTQNIDDRGKPRKDVLPYLFIEGERASKPGLNGMKLSWYHRSEVREAASLGRVTWIVEGEPKADVLRAALRDAGRNDAVTSPPGGCVTAAMAAELRGSGQVVVLGDNDAPGLQKAQKAAQLALAHASDVRLLETLPNVGDGGDIADWIGAGGTVAELLQLVADRPAVRESTTIEKLQAAASSPVKTALESRNDLGNAAWFISLFGDVARYNRDQQKWFFWEGMRWRADRGTDAMKYAKQAIKKMMQSAIDSDNSALLAYALKCGKLNTLKSMLETAQSDDRVDRGQTDFDADTWLVNVANGTLDLRSGALKPHDPNDHITTLIPVEYDQQVRSELWETTLDQVFEGRQETVRYFQRAVGYSMTGDVRHECFFLLYGDGRNGKGTIVEATQELLAEYRRTTQFETFLKKRFPGAINNEMAELAGARMVVASESEDGRSFSTGTLKNLTGGDEVTTRFLYKNLFTYKPTFKVWLITNFKPAVDPEDYAFWERCKVIPFKHTFEAAERDETLKKRLRSKREQQGILTWAVEGCLAWQASGIGTCPDVEDGTKAYRVENDHVQQWLEQACILRDGLTAGVGALVSSYGDYCVTNNIKPWLHLTPTALGKRLEKRFPKDSRGKKRLGIGLKAEDAEEGRF